MNKVKGNLSKILDDLDKIKKIDVNGMLSFCIETPKHYKRAAKLTRNLSISYSKPQTIIIAGMGGFAIGGEILKDFLRDKIKVPVEVCREYSLPSYANEKTLAFVISNHFSKNNFEIVL